MTIRAELEAEKETTAPALQTEDWTQVEKVIFELRSVRSYKSDQVPEHLVRLIRGSALILNTKDR